MNFSDSSYERTQPPTDIEQAIAAMHAADRTAREKLPPLPEGQEWHAELDVALTADGRTLARLTYTVRSIVGERRARHRRVMTPRD